MEQAAGDKRKREVAVELQSKVEVEERVEEKVEEKVLCASGTPLPPGVCLMLASEFVRDNDTVPAGKSKASSWLTCTEVLPTSSLYNSWEALHAALRVQVERLAVKKIHMTLLDLEDVDTDMSWLSKDTDSNDGMIELSRAVVLAFPAPKKRTMFDPSPPQTTFRYVAVPLLQS